MISKILIADDELLIHAALGRNIRRAFRRRSVDIEVRKAENGEETRATLDW